MSDVAEERFKSLLIVNESNDAKVTLYLYHRRDLICKVAIESKVIKPNGKYLHRGNSKGFKFEIVARFKDGRAKEILQESKECKEDKLLRITKSLDESLGKSLKISEERLEDFQELVIVCLRKSQRDKELRGTNGRRNLYEILGLDMNAVREMLKKDPKEAIKLIKKGYQREKQRWHPDNNFGDDENEKEISNAYDILMNEEKRAYYHNEVDYGDSWFSLKTVLNWKRLRVIFWPERATEEQKKAHKHRMIMFALSVVIAVGGIVLTACTAGLAAPVVVVIGAVFGSGLLFAGIQSLPHAMSRTSVVDKCGKNLWQQYQPWLIKAGIGFVAGAVIGGAAVGITAAVAGLGEAAMESAALTIGQYVEIGAGSGAVCGGASSLATDAGRKFADGETVTWKQFFGHAVCGVVVGAAAGAAGGAVVKSFVNVDASAAAANLEGEIGKQVTVLTGARRLGKILTQRISRVVTENGTEAFVGSVAQFTEERLDDSVENRNPGKYLMEGAQNVFISTVKGAILESRRAVVSHAWNEIKVTRRINRLEKEHSQPLITPLVDDDTSVVGPLVNGENEQITKGRVRWELAEENNEHRVNWQSHSKYTSSYQPLVLEEPSLDDQGASPSEEDDVRDQSDDQTVGHSIIVDHEDDVSVQSNDCDEPEDCRVKYISEGYWFSRMVVSYSLKGKRITQEVRGSGKSVTFSGHARQLEVKFQVRRPFWGDVKEYDRFKGYWCKPDQPHVFKFDTPPPVLTFTISGSLWYEAVMRVSNDYHDETKEM